MLHCATVFNNIKNVGETVHVRNEGAATQRVTSFKVQKRRQIGAILTKDTFPNQTSLLSPRAQIAKPNTETMQYIVLFSHLKNNPTQQSEQACQRRET